MTSISEQANPIETNGDIILSLSNEFLKKEISLSYPENLKKVGEEKKKYESDKKNIRMQEELIRAMLNCLDEHKEGERYLYQKLHRLYWECPSGPSFPDNVVQERNNKMVEILKEVFQNLKLDFAFPSR
ncbi:hypothetical protein K9M59_00370 [Candidatus Gracilibacteria bacterium]|nr:hypothetical protein [Candidatus Gracilibacteria bacterium]MCF7819035.1 hypothetical protein [Candidatus Gracilibacteria bacterium]